MSSSIKRLFLFLALTVFLYTSAALCFADTGNFDFSLNVSAEDFTDLVNKADNSQKFYVTTLSHNLKAGDSFWYGPRRGSTIMSNGLRFTTAKDPRQKGDYTKTAYANDKIKLRGNFRPQDITSGDAYTINISGQWTP
ncbi:MAG: hypothetical protein IJ214_07980 [Clostridia bacterium]|nr:hypothetical protein [Clostridia bacterium]